MSPDNKHEIFDRVQGIFDTDLLQGKVITIIGCGSLGSINAVELAKCGVSHFQLVDHDVLEKTNIPRHACGLRDVGRSKVAAVKDAILNINDLAQVKIWQLDITQDWETTEQIIAKSNLVLVCTDYDIPRQQVNETVLNLWRYQNQVIPIIIAGVYERAFGGEVFRIIPGQTSCYDCIRKSLDREGIGDIPPEPDEADYTDTPAQDFAPEPGLGIDVGFIALLQAKMALLTLLRGTSSQLEDVPYDQIIWGNRPYEDMFKNSFTRIFAQIAKRDDCLTCVAADLSEEAKEILAQIEK